jgi:hypothetical protein
MTVVSLLQSPHDSCVPPHDSCVPPKRRNLSLQPCWDVVAVGRLITSDNIGPLAQLHG